eukprot:4433620-Prymnesium_polylepis.3
MVPFATRQGRTEPSCIQLGLDMRFQAIIMSSTQRIVARYEMRDAVSTPEQRAVAMPTPTVSWPVRKRPGTAVCGWSASIASSESNRAVVCSRPYTSPLVDAR